MRNSYSLPLFTLLLFFSSFNSYAQGRLDNQFRFSDGIYLSCEEYFTNSPSILFDDENLPVAKYGKFNESQFLNMVYINSDGEEVKLNMKDVWGISVKGVPYVFCGFSVANETDISFLTNTIKKTRNLVFNEVIYVGNISLYSFNHESWMIKSNLAKPERITLKNVKELIKDDLELVDKFKTARNKRKNKHSFLVEYNRRNPIILNQMAQNNH